MWAWIPAIPHISLETANKFYAFGWRASLVGAVITAIGVVFLFWGTRVRDHDFDFQMSGLNREAALSRERADGLEKQNLELKVKFAGRSITAEQHEALVAELSKARATVNFEVLNDTESELYAVDLQRVFRDAGWHIGKTDMIPLGELWIGLSFNVPSNDPLNTSAIAAFEKAHVPFGRANRGKLWPVTVTVGAKPRVP